MNVAKKSKVYDVVKVITTLLVVIAHVTRMYTPTGVFDPLNESKILDYLTEYIYKFHMPLFVCVSGCVYGYCVEVGKYQNNKLFLKNKIKRLLIPYFFCGLFYVAPIMQLLRIDTQGYWKYCVSGIILSYNSRHLWYIFTLFWIFMLAMFVRTLLKSKKGLCSVLLISLIIYRYAYLIPGTFQLQSAARYQIYFFLGVLINHLYDKISGLFKRSRYVTILLPFSLTMMFVWNPNQFTNIIYICIGITMIFVFAQWLSVSKKEISDTFLYNCIRSNSFGIYLFHPMIIYVLFYLFGDYDISPFILSTVIFGISTAGSIFITYVLRKWRLGVLIGEDMARKI